VGLITYGPLAAEVAKTVGGVTFARGYTAKTCRSWRAPTNKRTPGQIFSRQTLSYFAHLWFTELSNAERAAWDAYALTCEFTNSLNDPYHLNGYNMFIRILSTINAYTIGTWPHTAPTQSGFPETLNLSFYLYADTGDIGELHLTDIDPVPTVAAAVIWTVHTLRPITRVHPFKATVQKGYFPTNTALPRVIYTFPAFPAAAAEKLHTLIIWHYLDSTGRLSKPIPQFVVAQNAP